MPEEQCQRTDPHPGHIYRGLHETSPVTEQMAAGHRLNVTSTVDIFCPGVTGPSRS